MNHTTIGIHINDIHDLDNYYVIEGIHGDTRFIIKTTEKPEDNVRDIIVSGKILQVIKDVIHIYAETIVTIGYDGCMCEKYENEAGDSTA